MVIIRLMYAASSSPRDSSISARIASSSRPSCSTSSSVRWVYSLTSAMAMVAPFGGSSSRACGQMSSVQSPTAAVTQVWTGSLGSDVSSPLRRSRTVPLDEGERAGVADAHPAAVGHADAGLLAGLQDGGGAVGLDGLVGVAEGDRAALAAVAAELEGEPLEVQRVLEAGLLPVLLDRVEHRRRAAGPGLALLPVRADRVEVGQLEHAVGVGVLLVQREPLVLLAELGELVAEDHPLLGRRGVVHDDVGHRAAAVEGAQHRHHRGDRRCRRPGRASSPAAGRAARSRRRARPAGRSCPARGRRRGARTGSPSGIARTVIAMVRPVALRRRADASRSASGTCPRPGSRCRRTGPGLWS